MHIYKSKPKTGDNKPRENYRPITVWTVGKNEENFRGEQNDEAEQGKIFAQEIPAQECDDSNDRDESCQYKWQPMISF